MARQAEHIRQPTSRDVGGFASLKRMIRSGKLLVVTLVVMAASACGPLPRLTAVPQAYGDQITVLGLKDIRFWGDEVTPQLIEVGISAYRRERAYATATGHPGPLPPAYFLAISGGGENGAFGAGLLVGWSATGTRPNFKVVTGISTGALTAPFAFLGPAYDDQLRRIYTEISAKDVLYRRWFLAALFN